MSPEERPALTRRGFITAAAVGSAGVLAACSTSAAPVAGPSSSAGAAALDVEPTGTWRIDKSAHADVEQLGIYTPNISVVPGETVPLYVGGKADTFHIDVFRIGHFEGLGGARVARMGPFPVPQLATHHSASETKAVSANWSKSFPLDTTGWEPGFYLVHAVTGNKRIETPLILRSPSVKDKVVVIMSESTVQAYNRWGGRSLYKDANDQFSGRSFAVNTNRPLDELGWRLLYSFETPVVRIAEESGVPVAYVSNLDVALDPSILDGAKAIVSTGHDEYWSVPYRDTLARLRDKGTNLAFLGGNAGYWRIRVDDHGPDGKTVTCYKDADLDPVKNSRRTTARWRDSPHGMPETTVTGMLYDAYPALGDMKVRDPDFFLFKGTGVREGTTFPGLLAIETDRYYDIESTPRPIQAPTVGEVDCRGEKTWSTMTYYSTDSGAGVWSVGTMGWCTQMPRWVKDLKSPSRNTEFTKDVTMNMFKEFAKGPAGRAHPATNDAKELNFPTTNTTGSA